MGGQRTKKQCVLRHLLPQNTLFFCSFCKNNEKVVIIPEILISGIIVIPILDAFTHSKSLRQGELSQHADFKMGA
jgi:hypothetical protein